MGNYNGWTNYETWLAKLWLGDLLAQHAEHGADITADHVREIVDEMAFAMCDGPDASGLMNDLLNSALQEINYDEIASHYVREEGEV